MIVNRTVDELKAEVQTGYAVVVCHSEEPGEQEMVLADYRGKTEPEKADTWWFDMLERQGFEGNDLIRLRPDEHLEMLYEAQVYEVQFD